MASVPSSGGQRSTPTAIALAASAILAVAVMLVFGQALEFQGAILDDGRNLILNPNVGTFSHSDVIWALTPHPDYVPRYIPLAWLGIDLELSLFGLAPAGLHLATLGLHLINTVALEWVILRFLKKRGIEMTAKSVAAAFVAAGVYGLHPLRAELAGWSSCVIWQASVSMLLIWAWIRTSAKEYPLLESVAYAASLLIYPVALGLAPGLAIAQTFTSGWRAPLRKNAPILVIATVCGFVTLLLASEGAPSNHNEAFPLLLRAEQGLAIEGRSLGALIAPKALNPYVQPLDRLISGNPIELAGAVVVLAVFGFALTKRGRPLMPWVIIYLFLVGPFTWVTSWRNPETPDRYFTAAHLFLAAGLALWLARRKSAWPISLAAVALAWWAFLARTDVQDWRDETALFRKVESTLDPSDSDYPQKFAFMHLHIALALMDAGDRAGAERTMGDVLASDPHNSTYQKAAATLDASANLPSATVLQHQRIVSQAFIDENPAKAALHMAEIKRLDPGFYDKVRDSGRH